MKMVKSLILGSAAGLLAMSGAQAADLPVKAKAVEYVRICSLYGAGFYYIPGTDTWISYEVKETGFHFRLNKGVPGTMQQVMPSFVARVERPEAIVVAAEGEEADEDLVEHHVVEDLHAFLPIEDFLDLPRAGAAAVSCRTVGPSRSRPRRNGSTTGGTATCRSARSSGARSWRRCAAGFPP